MKIRVSHKDLIEAYDEAAAIALREAGKSLDRYLRSNLCVADEIAGIVKAIAIVQRISVILKPGQNGRPFNPNPTERN